MTKSTLERLTSLGEEVIGKASQNPNLARVVGAATQLKDRVDDLSKRVRGLESDGEAHRRARASGSRSSKGPQKRAAPSREEAGSLRALGHADAQRRRHDLERRRRRPDLLALELDRQLDGRVHLDARRAQHLHLRVVHVLALVDLRRGGQEVELRDVADQDDVELPVVGRRVRVRASSRRRARRRSRRSRRACGRGARCRRGAP